MHSHTPPDRGAFDSPDFEAAPPPADRNLRTERSRSAALPMIIAVLVLAAIIVAIILL